MESPVCAGAVLRWTDAALLLSYRGRGCSVPPTVESSYLWRRESRCPSSLERARALLVSGEQLPRVCGDPSRCRLAFHGVEARFTRLARLGRAASGVPRARRQVLLHGAGTLVELH